MDGDSATRLGDVIVGLFQVIPSCIVLLLLMGLSWYALRLIRVHLSKTELSSTEYLESFQKLHEEGELTDEEFRLVRRLVSLQLTRSPDAPKPDYSLLNQNAPPQPVDRPSGKIPKI
jgi:hypothetical protein